MATIRSRAIELAADPTNFERPVPEFDNPGDAKLEADAYLALCADDLTTELYTSPERRQDFFNTFSPQVLRRFGRQANHRTDHNWIKVTFIESFRDAYVHTPTIETTFSTAPQAANTETACRQFLELSQAFIDRLNAQGAGCNLANSIQAYESAPTLLHLGLMALVDEVPQVLRAIDAAEPEERPALLSQPITSTISMCSLSIAQMRASSTRGTPVVTGDRVNTAPNIRSLRARPLYATDHEAVMRPHRGCPAMPDLPATDFLYGGSGVLKMISLATDLIQATNVHMLDSDLPEHSVTHTAQSYGMPVYAG